MIQEKNNKSAGTHTDEAVSKRAGCSPTKTAPIPTETAPAIAEITPISAETAAISILDKAGIERSLKRIAHEILEANSGAANIVLVGIVTRGDLLAAQLAAYIEQIEGVKVQVGRLDISFYRDDIASYAPTAHKSEIPFSLEGKTVILVDDILYTGRTIRCALDALRDFGRPACVQLAVLIDRGHRELPIRPDFVGKNIPTSKNQNVYFLCEPLDGKTCVEISDASNSEHVGSAPVQSAQALDKAFEDVVCAGDVL